MLNRRTFLSTIPAAVAPLWARGSKIKLGVTDWNLALTGKLEAVALAAKLEFEGVQLSIGNKPADGKMPLDDAARISAYIAEAKARKVAITSTCLDILHVNCLKNDKLAEKWISDGIRITKALGTKVMLLPFFGKCAMASPAEVDAVGGALRNLASEAEKAKVVLGVENTISAADNLRILELAKSPAVLVYYDIGNSTNNGFDITREIQQLGAGRICQIHFKDNPGYLGEGKVNIKDAFHAVTDIGYQGWIVLETSSPSKSVEADMRRNLIYMKRLMTS